MCVRAALVQAWDLEAEGEEEGDDELFWANVFWDNKVAAAEAAEEAKRIAKEKAKVATDASLGLGKAGGKKKVLNPFGV